MTHWWSQSYRYSTAYELIEWYSHWLYIILAAFLFSLSIYFTQKLLRLCSSLFCVSSSVCCSDSIKVITILYKKSHRKELISIVQPKIDMIYEHISSICGRMIAWLLGLNPGTERKWLTYLNVNKRKTH